MNEQTYATPVVAVGPRQDSRLPATLVVILLLLLLPLAFLFSRWLLDNCIADIPATTAVLGASSFDVDADVDQAEGGDVVTFTVTGENNGPLTNGAVIFNVLGQGTITTAPVGTGTCLRISSTQATCTGVTLLSNEDLSYAVQVVVDAACGLIDTDTVGLTADLNDPATVLPQDATASGSVNCVTAPTTSSSSSSSSSSSGGATTPTNTTTNGNGADTTGTDTGAVDGDSTALAACYTYANNGLLLALGLILLLVLIIYMVTTWATRRKY